MYLKSLQMIGFKSFADRTTLQFHRGVTAIVGPNGCGKSNVLDSIRWVLGEQSAKALRGGEMKDVIFSGSDSRPALGMSEVSLTFGECEKELGVTYNEVTITRRVFRDGASEYEMNKTPCRLRDIQQIFMNTGVGRSAYSIMEQGKIDLILSSHPEDRRAIFEEAAGITKFKSQRKEALRKLEHTEANLLRIADIAREVKRQIGSLQRQAGKARRYREVFDDLFKLESKWARHQFDLLQKEIDQLQKMIDSEKSRQEELNLSVATEEMTLQQERDSLELIENRLTELREKQNETRNMIERNSQRRQTNEDRAREFTDLKERCYLEAEGTEEKIKAQQEQLAHLEQQLFQNKSQLVEAEKSLRHSENLVCEMDREIAATRNDQKTKSEQISFCEETILTNENRLSTLEAQKKTYRFRTENLRSEQASFDEKRRELSLQLDQVRQELQSVEEAVKKLKDDLREFQQKELQELAQTREAEQATTVSSRNLQGILARYEALTQLEISHAGAGEATQEILAAVARGELSIALHGVLADHIKVKPGYEKAMALLFGEAIQAIIIEKCADAEAIFSQLQKGSSQQLALSVLDFPRPVPPLNSFPNQALQFVEADDTVLLLVQSLLSDCFIETDFAAAIALKRAHPESIIATQNGELINRAGFTFVGKQEVASLAILNLQTEIRQLEEKKTGAEIELREHEILQEQMENLLSQSRHEIQEMKTRLRENEMQAHSKRHFVQTLEKNIEEFSIRAESLNREIDLLARQETNDQQSQIDLQKVLEEEKLKLGLIVGEELEMSRKLNEQETAKEKLLQALTENKIQLATLRQQYESWQQQRDPVAQRLIELRDLIMRRRREVEDYEQRVVQAQNEITQAILEMEQSEIKLKEFQLLIQEEQEKKSQSQSQITDQEKKLREVRKAWTELQTVRSEAEIKLAEKKMMMQNLEERMHRQYQTALRDLPAIPNSTEETNWEALEIEVDEKRKTIEAMGAVNLDAITEYDELEERHQFLETQQNDLLKAKEQLLTTIQQINQTTQKLFAETFAQVKINFQEMFIELFGGGKATLVLLNENDPLECGIDIVAKPPGKQLQNVSLLSGGERTMTAVALLFAIYLVKPSPFCVLDEMDAPLDESNITRFIKILQRFIHQSQFVVITHNKRTISMADVLYGVTMEERGVSKFVSVKLANQDRSRETANATSIDSRPSTDEPLVPSVAESFGKFAEVPA